EISCVGELEPEVGNAAAAPRLVRLVRILVQRDEIAAAGCLEEHHGRSGAELLLHPEHAPVEAQRALEIAHDEMDVVEAPGLDHVATAPRERTEIGSPTRTAPGSSTFQ